MFALAFNLSTFFQQQNERIASAGPTAGIPAQHFVAQHVPLGTDAAARHVRPGRPRRFAPHDADVVLLEDQLQVFQEVSVNLSLSVDRQNRALLPLNFWWWCLSCLWYMHLLARFTFGFGRFCKTDLFMKDNSGKIGAVSKKFKRRSFF